MEALNLIDACPSSRRPPLLALLQTHRDLGLPWANLVFSDILALRKALANVFTSLPPPDIDIVRYWHIISGYSSMWREIVIRYRTPTDDVVLGL